MRLKNIMRQVLVAVAFPITMSSFADEWFVDMTRPDDTGDGKTEESAFRTIKAAIEVANANDIVTVMPGVYANEWAIDNYGYTNRVYINKPIRLRSRYGAEKTIIQGCHDPSTGDIGSGAIRCVLGVEGAIVEGFTLANGAGHSSGADVYHSWAGGATKTDSTNTKFYLVDCIVTNCTGYRGGAVRYVTAVRCKFLYNYGTTGNLARNIVAINCLIVGNGNDNTRGYITDAGTSDFYNCTLANNISQYAHVGARLFNCVETPVLGSGNGYLSTSTGNITVTNTVLKFGKLNTRNMQADEVSAINPPKLQFFASAMGDYHLVSGADAVGMGDPTHLSNLGLPEPIDPYIDIEGNQIPRTGAIQAGCFQTIKEPAGGAVVFSSPGTLNGHKVYSNSYAHPSEYPVQWNFKANIAEGKAIYAYIHAGTLQFPLMDDSFAFMPPSNTDAVITNIAKTTSNVYYVSPSGSDDNDGLTAATPFKTLQKAAVVAPNSSWNDYDKTMSVIYAASGDYKEGGELHGGVTNRIAFTTKRIRVKGAGRDSTTIFGRHDPTSPAGDGRGPKAERCAYINSYDSALQGFTLANGACSYEGDGTGSTSSQLGGAVYGYLSILDCTITNSSAYRGAAVYGTASSKKISLHRTRVTGCTAGNGLMLYTVSHGCLFDYNNGLIRAENRLWHCTVYAPEGSKGAIASGTMATNCIAREYTKTIIGSGSVNCTGGNIFYGFDNVYGEHAEKGNSVLSPQFNDELNADFRVKTTSPALSIGIFDKNYWEHYTLDVNGNKPLFFNGKPLAGGVQDVLQVVSSPKSEYCTITPEGEIALEKGESVTWTATDFIRPPIGFETNGVPTETNIASFTYDAAAQIGVSDSGIKFVFGTNWYVNATTGLDENTGFAPDSAKKTLSAAMATALLDGDIVHLAEGVYSNGLMYSGSANISNRVVVSKAITLVGDEGADKTFIEGAEPPSPTYTNDDMNLGPGAVRCAYLINSGATVRGITFRYGHTYYLASSSASLDCHGGGVIASSEVIFEDCNFTSNKACRGGAATGGTFRRCKFFDNYGPHKSAHLMSYNTATGANSHNCIFGRAFGSCMLQDIGEVVGCLIEDKSFKIDGTKNGYGIVPNTTKPFANNIICTALFRPAANFYPSNCVYVSTANSAGADYFFPQNCILTNVPSVYAELEDGTYKIKSRTSWLVDAGATEYAHLGGESDLAGSQRVYNATVDIGPFEYDWRERYSETIGKTARVTYASPMVNEQNAKVLVPDGASISMSVDGKGIKGVNVLVDEGELYASGGRNDETITSDCIYKIQTPADVTLAYSGNSAAVIDSIATKPGYMIVIR